MLAKHFHSGITGETEDAYTPLALHFKQPLVKLVFVHALPYNPRQNQVILGVIGIESKIMCIGHHARAAADGGIGVDEILIAQGHKQVVEQGAC